MAHWVNKIILDCILSGLGTNSSVFGDKICETIWATFCIIRKVRKTSMFQVQNANTCVRNWCESVYSSRISDNQVVSLLAHRILTPAELVTGQSKTDYLMWTRLCARNFPYYFHKLHCCCSAIYESNMGNPWHCGLCNLCWVNQCLECVNMAD